MTTRAVRLRHLVRGSRILLPLFQPEIRAASRRAPTPQTVTSVLTSEDRRERVKAMYRSFNLFPGNRELLTNLYGARS
jgi:hypothetical protein